MPVKCSAVFKSVNCSGDGNIAELSLFWRDMETKEHLLSITARVAIPITMQNIEEIKSFALKRAKELIFDVSTAEYESMPPDR